MSYARAFRNPTFVNPTTGKAMPNDSGWQTRHVDALKVPRGFERPIIEMIEAWARYADTHRVRYESPTGNDYVLGPSWAAVGAGIRALLNGDTGRLDCGTLDSFLHNTLTFEGFNPDLLP